jgi:hypothetical protein
VAAEIMEKRGMSDVEMYLVISSIKGSGMSGEVRAKMGDILIGYIEETRDWTMLGLSNALYCVYLLITHFKEEERVRVWLKGGSGAVSYL